jgi:K+-transporting ATPase ATPase A chain
MNATPYLEGKETRFGVTNSILWATITTATSNGSVNTMHDSLSPIAGGVAMLNIMLGEHIFGGVGVGLCSMIMFVLATVFLSGLMVGRTPEYLGKKIEKKDIQWVIIALLAPSALILIGAGVSSILPEALASVTDQGPHGLSQILYAFSSAAGNNGSAFAGLNANTNYYNIVLGIVMLLGRLSMLIPCLGLAGHLAAKRNVVISAGTLSTMTFLFAALLFSVILIICALTFFPALSLGPIVEQLLMIKGDGFPPVASPS